MSYFQQLGFDEPKKQARLALLGLAKNDGELIHVLHDAVIKPHLNAIIDEFYRQLTQDAEFNSVFERGFKIEKLKQTQAEYLQSLGLGFDQQDYFESRLRIGMVHIWAGINLSLYLCAYRVLQQLLIDHIPATSSSQQRAELASLIRRITFLDMTLAVEAYHNAQMDSLTGLLDASRARSARLHDAAHYDALTQVHSRASTMEVLAEAVKAKRCAKRPFCLIMLDLDLFKAVNDQFGHPVGDQALIEIARRIKAALRQIDDIGRYGGEEFMIVLRETALPVGKEIAERIRRAVAAHPISIDGHHIPMTVSLGLAEAAEQQTGEQLIAEADAALYRAKAQGRNRVEVADAAGG